MKQAVLTILTFLTLMVLPGLLAACFSHSGREYHCCAPFVGAQFLRKWWITGTIPYVILMYVNMLLGGVMGDVHIVVTSAHCCASGWTVLSTLYTLSSSQGAGTWVSDITLTNNNDDGQ